MDWEAPVDGWYIWIAVGLVSLGLVGVVLGLPTHPPPDAARAANTIDRVTGTPHQARAHYEPAANEIKIDTRRIAMRNDGGTATESVAFGSITPVHAIDNNTLQQGARQIARGESPTSVLADGNFESEDLLDAARRARISVDHRGAN